MVSALNIVYALPKADVPLAGLGQNEQEELLMNTSLKDYLGQPE